MYYLSIFIFTFVFLPFVVALIIYDNSRRRNRPTLGMVINNAYDKLEKSRTQHHTNNNECCCGGNCSCEDDNCSITPTPIVNSSAAYFSTLFR